MMMGVSCGSRICFRVRASTFWKRVPKDRECREPTSQLERAMRKCDIRTYLIQIVNKRDEVILLKVLNPSFILPPVKYLVELIAEVGRRSVEG